MSSRIRPQITKEMMAKEFVSVEDKAQVLATAIYQVQKSHPFIGSVLQCLTISYTHQIPTAGIMFNVDAKSWAMLINPFFFAKKLKEEHRKAVLLHEIYHIVHKHPMRVPFMKVSAKKRQLLNISADMSINQMIKNLPYGCPSCPPPDSGKPCQNELCPGKCIDVKNYFDTDEKTGERTQWAHNLTMEAYYELLIKRFDDPENGKGDGDGDGDGEGNAGGGANSGDLPQTIDEHMWDGAGDEKEMLDATEELVKRAMIKARLSYDDVPGSVKELLDEISARKAELNYKAIIMAAMKRHAAGHDRKHSWTRKSKRFGFKAPGTKVAELPRLELHLDTSGSISIEELNEFVCIVDEFLRVGARKCNLSFFHTALYGRRQHKMGTKINREDVESGGTDLESTLKDIFIRRGNLSIIVTDGCYGNVDWKSWLRPGEQPPQIQWIISEGGDENHPLKDLGSTIKCPSMGTKRRA